MTSAWTRQVPSSAPDAAPEREGEAELELHLIFTRIIRPVIGAYRLFVEIAGLGVDHVVCVIRVQRERIVMLLKHIGDDAALNGRFIMHLFDRRFLRICCEGQRNRRQ